MLGGGWNRSKIGECCPGGLRDLHEMDLGVILMVTIGLFGLKKKSPEWSSADFFFSPVSARLQVL